MKKILFLFSLLAVAIFFSGCITPICGNGVCELGENQQKCPQDCGNITLFKFSDGTSDKTVFVFGLSDSKKIQEARDILSGKKPQLHIMGTIIKQPAQYNAPWNYQLDVNSIIFFENAMEVCDASIQYVEDHLDEVGGDFLPGNVWCPWGSVLIEEVQ